MRRQQGFSFFAIAFFLALLGGIISLSLKIIPPYMDFLTISSATLETLKQPRTGLQTNDVIRQRIDKQMSINNLRLSDYQEDALTLSREDGEMYAEIDYTVLQPVFDSENFQVALSLHFNKTHEVDLGSE